MNGTMADEILDPCAGCTGRRDFLREAAGIAAALLVGLGAGRAQAQGVVPAPLRPAAVRGGQVTYPIPPADGVSIDREREVIVVRWQARAYAFALSCPHQRTMLRWQQADGRFQCPKHRSRYQPDGTFVSGRATRGMDRYPLRAANGALVVDVARPIRQDQDRVAWDAAFVAV
ncbi:MAG TPA: Rieske (2Fe-2S) protein [Longimicrobium sp.]|nr:Rieske (2Fe-2S) protein [Longimicrobium sp.]